MQDFFYHISWKYFNVTVNILKGPQFKHHSLLYDVMSSYITFVPYKEVHNGYMTRGTSGTMR